jgi:hypothetical protein
MTMNIEKLVAAAKKIDELAARQDSKTKRYAELASAARKVIPHSPEHMTLQDEAKGMATTVIDFGGAINELRRALKAKPARCNAATPSEQTE